MSALSSVARASLRHPPGRVQGNGLTVTVFGCTGFIGRYVCAELGEKGHTIVAPYRGDISEVNHIRVMADLGNTASVPFSARDPASVREAVKGSDVVLNLIGKHYQTKHLLPWWINYTYDDVHVHAAETIARVCAEEKIPRFIHVSSILAKPNSPSIWAASKYRGEIAVRKAFPKANIVRLGAIYGPEDRLLNWIANRMQIGGVPLVDNGDAVLQPAFVNDVAAALYAMTIDEYMTGETFELVGDEKYTAKELADYVFDATKHPPNLINLPLSVARLIGKFIEQFPDPRFTADWAVRLGLFQVKTSNFPGFRELDIEPAKMEKEAPNFLLKYNRAGHFQEVSGYH
uniref:NADH dehydrogenase putative n=1 Tax=Albugo laibachii Nc14 TaxID=890382 RepID=F0W525_9STRA|nr:NADH dehydrogenase putative [Albugo laibachii Nc14]|eukprot:CCA16216.1 NADH dehydrogenase putative [Albugo laibachii Nc14]